jgi:hypothetical protein
MSDKWDDVLERERRKTSPGGVPSVEGEAALPGLDDPYKAVANLSNGREEVLCCILGRDAYQAGQEVYRFFQYVHLASNTGLAFGEGGRQVMRLRFVGPEPVTITVSGRDLLRACHLIHRHRIGWIRLFDAERNFPFLETEAGKRREIITGLDIDEDEPGAGRS